MSVLFQFCKFVVRCKFVVLCTIMLCAKVKNIGYTGIIVTEYPDLQGLYFFWSTKSYQTIVDCIQEHEKKS